MTPEHARMVLGKDSHPSPQHPRHSLKPEPSSPRQVFSVSQHGLRQAWGKVLGTSVLEYRFCSTRYAEKRYYKGIYLNFFRSYNFSIVSGGHFGFLQTKHE